MCALESAYGFQFPCGHTPSIAYKQIYINPVENNRMKILLFCKFSILFISVLLPQSLSPKITSDGGCRKAPRRASARVVYSISRIHRMERDSQ